MIESLSVEIQSTTGRSIRGRLFVIARRSFLIYFRRFSEFMNGVLFDVPLMTAIHRLQSPFVTKLMIAVTQLGTGKVVFSLAVLLMILWTFKRRYADMAVLAFLTLGSKILIDISKILVDRPRPTLFKHLVEETSKSFPSGHAVISVSLFGFLIYLALIMCQGRWKWRIPAAFALAFMIMLIGISRIYLGVHWPTDVLGGYLIGGVWLYLGILIRSGFKKPRA